MERKEVSEPNPLDVADLLRGQICNAEPRQKAVLRQVTR